MAAFISKPLIILKEKSDEEESTQKNQNINNLRNREYFQVKIFLHTLENVIYVKHT